MRKIYEFDTIILGGGPAGLSAGIYASRSMMKTALIDISMPGGQPSNYSELENYPGSPLIKGYELMEKFEIQADSFGLIKFPMQEIQSVNLISNPKTVVTLEGIFKSKSVIIACGVQPKKLGIEGEDEFFGRGVSYCAVCDGNFYLDKTVAVIGGGNSAVEEGIYLTKFAREVYIIHRRNELRADKIIQTRAKENDKIEFIFDTVVKKIDGNGTVEKIMLENIKTGNTSELKIDGIFPYIGIVPNVSQICGQILQDEIGFIITDETMKTSVDGVYAAGDIRRTPLRQVITAASDGAVSAVYAGKYIESVKKSSNMAAVKP